VNIGLNERRVADIMVSKPFLVNRSERWVDAARGMRNAKTGDAVIVDDTGRPVALLCSRDFHLLAFPDGPLIARTRLGDARLPGPPATIKRTSSLRDAVNAMDIRRVTKLVVVDEDGRCLGLIHADQILDCVLGMMENKKNPL